MVLEKLREVFCFHKFMEVKQVPAVGHGFIVYLCCEKCGKVKRVYIPYD